MPIMLGFIDKEKIALEDLGVALKTNRKRRGDTQADAADRCGVSRETYRKMEQGNPGAGIGNWVRAIRLYGEIDQLETLFPTSLFDRSTGTKR
ncbi:MAG: helix-turn-helix domain-containing protein [Candidatus Thiodiazotropha sp.]